jgi:hypothetical protein
MPTPKPETTKKVKREQDIALYPKQKKKDEESVRMDVCM